MVTGAGLKLQAGLGLTAGGLLALSMPPRGWWPLAVLGVTALTVAVAGAGWRGRLLAGGLAGVAFLYPTLTWVRAFSAPGYLLLAALESALVAAAVTVVPGRRRYGWWALPPALVLLEAVRERFPLGGFPLPAVALGQLDGPFAPAARLGGPLLVVGLVTITGTALAGLLLTRPLHTGLPRAGRRTATVGLLAGALAVAATLAGAAVPTTRETGRLAVVAVQGGGPRGVPAVFSDPAAVTARQFAATATITGTPDLVLWPEDVVAVPGPVTATPVGAELADLARQLGSTLVVGVVEDEGATRFRNAAVAWGPDSSLLGRYEKVHRVPFGEYLPARPLVSRLSGNAALVPRDAIPGRGPGLLTTPAGRLGVLISYEVFFPDRARAAVQAGAQVLLVPTNASSYTTEEVPAMEVAAARLRALETGRALVQAAPTGYSVLVDAAGRVTARSGLGTPAVLGGEVALRAGRTPYTRTGDLPVLVLSGLGWLAAALAGGRRRRVDALGRPGRPGPDRVAVPQ